MAFIDPTIPIAEVAPTRKRRAALRRKLNTIVDRKVNEKAMQNFSKDDTVEVKLDSFLRKARILKTNPTTAIIYVPATKEVWRVSGFYLRKVKPKDELL